MQYINELDVNSKLRYLEKIKKIGGQCPYELLYDKQLTFPPFSQFDITDYLIYKVSFYTKKQFKNYKSLEAYNQFKCKWVHNVRSKAIGGYFVVRGEVCYFSILYLFLKFCSIFMPVH